MLIGESPLGAVRCISIMVCEHGLEWLRLSLGPRTYEAQCSA